MAHSYEIKNKHIFLKNKYNFRKKDVTLNICYENGILYVHG